RLMTGPPCRRPTRASLPVMSASPPSSARTPLPVFQPCPRHPAALVCTGVKKDLLWCFMSQQPQRASPGDPQPGRSVTGVAQPPKQMLCLPPPMEGRDGLLGMVGNSEPMRQVYGQIQLVAPTRSTALVTGESGTGKELVALALHQLSPRKDGPFVALSC